MRRTSCARTNEPTAKVPPIPVPGPYTFHNQIIAVRAVRPLSDCLFLELRAYARSSPCQDLEFRDLHSMQIRCAAQCINASGLIVVPGLSTSNTLLRPGCSSSLRTQKNKRESEWILRGRYPSRASVIFGVLERLHRWHDSDKCCLWLLIILHQVQQSEAHVRR